MTKVIIAAPLIALGLGASSCEWLDEPGLGNEQARDQEGVELRGDVEEVYASGAFRFDPEEGLVNNDSVLVVRGKKGLAEVKAGHEATVTGEVQYFEDVTPEEFQKKYGMPLTKELLDKLDATSFVIAEGISTDDPVGM